jgi:HEAT repeat protein
VDEMLKVISTNQFGDIFTNSLIRLLGSYNNDKKFPVLIEAVNHPSPLVRSSAVNGLLGIRSAEVKACLLKAAKDPIRLVRLAAASSLSVFPREEFNAAEIVLVDQVNKEYEESLVTAIVEAILPNMGQAKRPNGWLF